MRAIGVFTMGLALFGLAGCGAPRQQSRAPRDCLRPGVIVHNGTNRTLVVLRTELGGSRPTIAAQISPGQPSERIETPRGLAEFYVRDAATGENINVGPSGDVRIRLQFICMDGG